MITTVALNDAMFFDVIRSGMLHQSVRETPQGQGRVIRVCLLPKEVENEALPMVDIFVNGGKCTALVDTG